MPHFSGTRNCGSCWLTSFLAFVNGIERLAAEDGRPALVVVDEFQQVVTEAGEKAERQIRAAVQRHRAVGYVFAGSSSRMMTEMVATSNEALERQHFLRQDLTGTAVT